ncbi:hypothetical protein [Alcaligenes nematophilus]
MSRNLLPGLFLMMRRFCGLGLGLGLGLDLKLGLVLNRVDHRG